MLFEFATAGRILFGEGVIEQAGKLVSGLGRRALVVHGIQNQAFEGLVADLLHHGVVPNTYLVDGEPDVQLVQKAITEARQHNCDVVIGIGGGSALDTGKAVAGLLPNPGEIYDYLEVVGKGAGLIVPALPYIAIPTTAGTGSEVTRNAVLGAELQGRPGETVKVSLRSVTMLPRLALIDPVLTYGLPPHITAATGMDALTQLIEPYLSNKANPLTDGLCREGITRAARSLLAAFCKPEHAAARADMSVASLFGGLALANAKLGAVHGFAAPIGGLYHAPHGAVCARLLPIVMKINHRALRQRDPGNPVLERFNEVGCLVTGRRSAGATDGIAWLEDLASALDIPGLGHYGVVEDDFSRLADLAARASSMQGNPVLLTHEELIEILSLAK